MTITCVKFALGTVKLTLSDAKTDLTVVKFALGTVRMTPSDAKIDLTAVWFALGIVRMTPSVVMISLGIVKLILASLWTNYWKMASLLLPSPSRSFLAFAFALESSCAPGRTKGRKLGSTTLTESSGPHAVNVVLPV